MPRLGRPLLALLAFLATAFVLAACGSDDDTASSSSTSTGGAAASAPKVKSTLRIGMNSPTYSTQMTTFVAQDEGYFKAEGINKVEVTTSDDYVAGLVGGSLDITQGDTDTLLLAADKGADVRLIGNYRSKEYQILAVKKGITTFADLKGETVTGGDRGGRNEAVVKSILSANGVSPSDVKLVPFGGGSDDRLQALLAGKVAATNLFPRHQQILEKAGGKFLADNLVDVPQESVATTGKFLKANEPTVEAYWRAILKARKFLTDPANAQRVIAISKAHDLEVIPEYEPTFPKEVDQISPDGAFDVAAMDKLIADEVKLDLLPSSLQWRDQFDFTALHAAQKAEGLPEAPTAAQLGQ